MVITSLENVTVCLIINGSSRVAVPEMDERFLVEIFIIEE
jgi:hypothetical protein